MKAVDEAVNEADQPVVEPSLPILQPKRILNEISASMNKGTGSLISKIPLMELKVPEAAIIGKKSPGDTNSSISLVQSNKENF